MENFQNPCHILMNLSVLNYFRVKNYLIFYFLLPFFPLLYYLIEITYDSMKLIKTLSIKQYPLIAKGKTKFI